jgi:uncharacterized membrane protein
MTDKSGKSPKTGSPAAEAESKRADSGADPGAEPAAAPEANPEPPVTHSGLTARLRNYLLAGILVTAPIGITVYLVWNFVSFVDSRVTPLIPPRYNPASYLPFEIPGFGLVVALVGLILIGALTANYAGRLFLRFSDRVMARTPIIRGVYGAIKQITETLLKNQSRAFREVVLVEYPRNGIWALAFVTGVTEGEVQELTEAEVVNVFLPTTPNPTSGFLLFVPRRDIVTLNMTVEEGIKMVISGGIITPPDLRPPEVKARTHEMIKARSRARNGAPVN